MFILDPKNDPFIWAVDLFLIGLFLAALAKGGFKWLAKMDKFITERWRLDERILAERDLQRKLERHDRRADQQRKRSRTIDQPGDKDK